MLKIKKSSWHYRYISSLGPVISSDLCGYAIEFFAATMFYLISIYALSLLGGMLIVPQANVIAMYLFQTNMFDLPSWLIEVGVWELIIEIVILSGVIVWYGFIRHFIISKSTSGIGNWYKSIRMKWCTSLEFDDKGDLP